MLSILIFSTAQAAVGIPDYLVPKNAGMQGINKTIEEKVKTASDQQTAAVQSVNIVLQYVANLLLFVAAPLAVLFVARSGADYAFAMGDETKMEGAKRELTWALLGLVLVMFSYLLVRLIIQPFPLLQKANDEVLGGGVEQTNTAQSGATGNNSTTSGAEKNLEDNIKQVEQNAFNNPNAKATMYDPSNNLGGVNAQIKYNGSTYEYYVDGDSVGKDNFQEMLKQYADKKK